MLSVLEGGPKLLPLLAVQAYEVTVLKVNNRGGGQGNRVDRAAPH